MTRPFEKKRIKLGCARRCGSEAEAEDRHGEKIIGWGGHGFMRNNLARVETASGSSAMFVFFFLAAKLSLVTLDKVYYVVFSH